MHALVSMGLVVTNELYSVTGFRSTSSDHSAASVAATSAIELVAATAATIFGERLVEGEGESDEVEALTTSDLFLALQAVLRP